MPRRFTVSIALMLAWWAIQAATGPNHATARPSIRVALEANRAEPADAATVRALTDSIQASIKQQAGIELVAREHADFVLWGAVTGLSDHVTRGQRVVDCKVSVIVADAVGGSIRFTLAGRAVARGDVRSSALTSEAMGAAVHGALSPLQRGLGAVLSR